MKNIENRLATIEEAIGINKLCDWCAYWSKQQRLFYDALASQGVKLHRPKPKDLKYDRCKECGRTLVYDLTFLTKQDREEYDRLAEWQAAEDEGCKPDRDWWARFIAVYDREEAALRAFYGAAFDVAWQKTTYPELRKWMEEKMQAATLNRST